MSTVYGGRSVKGIEASSQVVLHLKMQKWLKDSSVYNRLLVPRGNASISTDIKKFGDFSLDVTASNNGGIAVPPLAGLDPQHRDFLLEGWFYFTDLSTEQAIFLGRVESGWMGFRVTGANFNVVATSTAIFSSVAHGMSTGQWYYLALSRVGNTWMIQKDNAILATSASDFSYGFFFQQYAPMLIGCFDLDGSYSMRGYIGEFRLTIGKGRLTADGPPSGFLNSHATVGLDTRLPYPKITAVPKMTSNTTPFGTASVKTPYAGYEPYKLFDQNIFDTSSVQNGTPSVSVPVWWRYEFVSAKTIRSYRVINRNTSDALTPVDWDIRGSNDGGANWDVLDSRANMFPDNRVSTVMPTPVLTIANPGSYTLYELSVTRNSSNSSRTDVGLWELYED